MNNKIMIMMLTVVILTGSMKAFADKRIYVWTYEYKTVEKGKAEIESYFTLSTPDLDNLDTTMSVEHKIELEIGMTDRFDFAIYHIFGQEPGGSMVYKGFQFRERFKLAGRGKLFFDPLAYLEYKGKPDFSEHELEFKLILAKTINRFNISLNPIFEFEYEHEWEFKPEYALGLSYRAAKSVNLGFEAKGSENGHYIGPVISHGRDDLWVSLGSAFKVGHITAGKPEFQVRMLLGIGF